MKKFVVNIFFYLILMVVLDLVVGQCFDFLRSKARGGQTYKNEYILNHCEDDILILGSSRADHHYVPVVLEDSLGLSCFNAGEMGCGIIPAYIRYRVVSERVKPRLVLYEVTPNFDYLYQDEGYTQYLGSIRQYAQNRIVKDVYLDFSDNLEKIRLLSYMYCNNSKIIGNVKDIFCQKNAFKGYEPLYGKIMNSNFPSSIKQEPEPAKGVDSLKYKYVEQLIVQTKIDGVPLVFIISPSIDDGYNDKEFEIAFDLCEKYRIPILDNRHLDGFVNNMELFQDYTHLNHTGAIAYTKDIVKQIRQYVISK